MKKRGLGLVLAAPYDVILSDENVVQTDLLFVSTARASIVTEDSIHGAPDLIVEIVSATTRKRDEVTKRKLYERFVVQEYWVVDPELEIVKIFRRAQQGFGRAIERSKEANDILTTKLFAGFDLALTEIFARLTRPRHDARPNYKAGFYVCCSGPLGVSFGRRRQLKARHRGRES